VTISIVPTAPVSRAGNAAQVRAQAFQELNQGVTAYKRGDYALAIQRLESSASVALNSFRANYYLGLALIGDRRYGDALAPLEVALDLDPSHLRSHIATGDANLKMGDLNEAAASYYRAMKLRPEYPPSLDGLARILESQDRIPEAVQHFRRAIESNRGYAPAYTHLGDLYLRRGRYEEAVLLLEEAVSVQPDFAPGLNRLALAYGRLGLDNQAVAMIQRAMELEPNNAVHPATLGEIQLAKDFLSAAQTSFENALQLDASLPQARKGLAEVFRRRGEYLAALEQLNSVLVDGRLDAATRLELDEFRAQLELEEQDVDRLERLIDEGTAEEEDFGRLAHIYAGRRMWSHAVELQRFAPEGPEQQERLAYMLFQSGLIGEAHDLYADLAASSDDAHAALNNGVTLALLGDDADAVDAFQLALDRNPDLGRAHLYLGNALLRLERDDQAVVAYKAYLEKTNRGEAAERVRRILKQVDPAALRGLAPLTPPAAALDVEPEDDGDSP
jgi:tetratricopeptide (TPR) repeat protein